MTREELENYVALSNRVHFDRVWEYFVVLMEDMQYGHGPTNQAWYFFKCGATYYQRGSRSRVQKLPRTW
jgi:hypothetical protein